MISIQALIDQAVLRDSASYKSTSEPKFHISDAGKCYRQRFLKRLGVDRSTEIPLASLKKMKAGDAAHKEITYLLNKYRKLFASEMYVETDHLRGRFDGVVKDQGQKALFDIKSTEKWQMGKIKQNGPSKEHEMQLFTYWKFMREDYADLDQAALFYMKREDFEGKEFDYQWSTDIDKAVEAEWKPLIACWIKGELPPCTCDQDYDGKGPDYCMYKEVDPVTGETIGCCNESLMTEVEVGREEETAVT